jgi:hypothetical protein
MNNRYEAGLETILQSPKESGELLLIVRRPADDQREILQQAHFDPGEGLLGDIWKARGSRHTPDGSAHPDAQVALMNSRVIGLIEADQARWALAGDQLYIDLDLSEANLSPGTRLKVGSAILEVTGLPHTGCSKFATRFGVDALKFVNSPQHKALRLRGVHARVIQAGAMRCGDIVQKIIVQAG